MTGNVFRRILVGFDGSASAVAALRFAGRLGGKDGSLIALAVVSTDVHAETTGARQRAAAADHQRLEQRFADADVPGATLRFAVGEHPPDALAQYAIEHGFDVVVLGRHGTHGLSRVGHFTERLVREEHLAVLVAPEPRR